MGRMRSLLKELVHIWALSMFEFSQSTFIKGVIPQTILVKGIQHVKYLLKASSSFSIASKILHPIPQQVVMDTHVPLTFIFLLCIAQWTAGS